MTFKRRKWHFVVRKNFRGKKWHLSKIILTFLAEIRLWIIKFWNLKLLWFLIYMTIRFLKISERRLLKNERRWASFIYKLQLLIKLRSIYQMRIPVRVNWSLWFCVQNLQEVTWPALKCIFLRKWQLAWQWMWQSEWQPGSSGVYVAAWVVRNLKYF